jgi:hypothetical protein
MFAGGRPYGTDWKESDMRTLLAAAILVSAQSAAAATDSNSYELRDATDLLSICGTTANVPHYANAMGFCHGVLTGAFRYYEATVARENRFVCAPLPPPTRTQVMQGFIAWAQANDDRIKDPAVDALFRYLAEKYPCTR